MRKGALMVLSVLCLMLFHQAVGATVRHYTGGDGKSYTWYSIPIDGDLEGVAPEEIDELQILCDGEDLSLPLDEFTYLTLNARWQGGSGAYEYMMVIVPGAPKLGEYTFTLRSGAVSNTYSEIQSQNNRFPAPDTGTLKLRASTFSWEPISSATGPYYYRLEIQDPRSSSVSCSIAFPEASDRCDIVYPYMTSRVRGMTSHTVPDGFLTRGETYYARVSVCDAPNFHDVQNRSMTPWVIFTYGGGIPYMFVQHYKVESADVWRSDATEFNRLMFSVTDENGNPVTSVDKLTDVTLYGPGLSVVPLSPPVFKTYKLRYGSYSGSLDFDDDFTYVPVFYADLPDGLPAGEYRLDVTYDGAVFQRTYLYEGVRALPVVPASSFDLKEEASGALTWTWDVPEPFCSSSLAKDSSSRAVVEITREGKSMGWLFITVPPCPGRLTFPYDLIQTLNAMGDTFTLWIQVRTNTYGNRTLSNKLTLNRLEPTTPSPTKVEGTVTDADSGDAVVGAKVAFLTHGPTLTTDAGGAFSSSDVPSGTYDVQVSASSYFTKVLQEVKLSPGATHELSTSVSPKAPTLSDLSAAPAELPNNGLATALLTARVSHPSGPGALSSIVADLSSLGGKTSQTLYDDGSHGDATSGDGIYSYRTTAAVSTGARGYSLNVTAWDKNGFKALGSIELSVVEKAAGTVAPASSDTKAFINALESQDLVVSVRLNPVDAASMLCVRAGGCFTLTVYRPDGSLYDTYDVTDSIDITIEDAEPGKWRYETTNNCDTEVAYEIQTKGSGTGMMVGRVVDAFTGKGLTGALVCANTGGSTMTIEHGYFAGVAVAGTGAVIVELSGYKRHVRTGVAIQTGETTNLAVRLVPVSGPVENVPSGQNVYEIKEPKSSPAPPKQPVAASTTGGDLEVSALFPPYASEVDLYAGVVIDAPAPDGGLYLFDPAKGPVEFSGLCPWVSGTREEQSGSLWAAGPVSAMCPADYLFFSLVTPAGRGLGDFDLSYYTVTLAQPPPSGTSVLQIKKPKASPVAGVQPLAVKKAEDGDARELWAWFPPQEEPVYLYVGYIKPSEPEKVYLFSAWNDEVELKGTLTAWREAVTHKQHARIRSFSEAEAEAGQYAFFSLRTTDPAGLSSFKLVYFLIALAEGETGP